MRSIVQAIICMLCLCSPVMAEVIIFTGKTASPQKHDLWTPHATDEDMKAHEAQEKEIRSKEGDEAQVPSKPFRGDMKILRVLVEVGQLVVNEQPLLTYAFPPEDLQSERRKLSQSDMSQQESLIARVRADLNLAQKDVAELRQRLQRGTASSLELQNRTKDVELLRSQLRLLEDNLRQDKETNRGELELAKAKFGPKASKDGLPVEAKLISQEKGYVLWVNPDLKPGVNITKKTKLIVVGSMDPLIVRALVHEIQIPRLRVGDKATITFESLPGQVFNTSISRIQMSASAAESQMPSHFEVELLLPNPGIKLKDGLRGQVSVQVPDGPRE